jgi:hypothetical protein
MMATKHGKGLDSSAQMRGDAKMRGGAGENAGEEARESGGKRRENEGQVSAKMMPRLVRK